MLDTGAAAYAIGRRPARADGLRTIRFGIGLKAISAAVMNTLIGEELGYNRQEGFTLKPLALGTNANVQVALDKGDIDIGIGVPSFQLPLLAKGEWKNDVNFYEYTYPYKWDVVVKPGSPINSYQDLKGKRIGVSDFGATDYPVTKMVLKSIGIDPETDVKWIAVGNGVPAGVALERGQIDALAYHDVRLRSDRGGRPEAAVPAATEGPADGRRPVPHAAAQDPANRPGDGGGLRTGGVQGLAIHPRQPRGWRGSLPENVSRNGAARCFDRAGGGSDGQDCIAADQAVPAARPGVKMGTINPADFLAEAKLDNLTGIADVSSLYTNELIDQINDFDLKAVQAEASRYKA